MLRDIRPTGASAWDKVTATDKLFHLRLVCEAMTDTRSTGESSTPTVRKASAASVNACVELEDSTSCIDTM